MDNIDYLSNTESEDDEDYFVNVTTRKRKPISILSSDDDYSSDESVVEGVNVNGAGSDAEINQNSSDSDGGGQTAEKCAVCLNRFLGQKIGTPENCNHYFCLECIKEWAKKINTCPVDRIVFDFLLVRKELGGTVLEKVAIEKAQDDPVPTDNAVSHTVCEICRRGDREHRMLLCDGCDLGFHCECLDPPLENIPIEEWFCPTCYQAIFEGGSSTTINPGPSVVIRRTIPRTQASESVRHAIQRIRRTQYRTVRKKRSRSTKRKPKSKKRRSRKSRRKCKSRKALASIFPLLAPTVKQRIGNKLGLTKSSKAPQILRPQDSFSFSLTGDPNQLIDFEDSAEESFEGGGVAILRPTVTRLHSKIKKITFSTPTSANILGDIMSEQDILFRPSTDVVISENGSLTLKQTENRLRQCGDGNDHVDEGNANGNSSPPSSPSDQGNHNSSPSSQPSYVGSADGNNSNLDGSEPKTFSENSVDKQGGGDEDDVFSDADKTNDGSSSSNKDNSQKKSRGDLNKSFVAFEAADDNANSTPYSENGDLQTLNAQGSFMTTANSPDQNDSPKDSPIHSYNDRENVQSPENEESLDDSFEIQGQLKSKKRPRLDSDVSENSVKESLDNNSENCGESTLSKQYLENSPKTNYEETNDEKTCDTHDTEKKEDNENPIDEEDVEDPDIVPRLNISSLPRIPKKKKSLENSFQDSEMQRTSILDRVNENYSNTNWQNTSKYHRDLPFSKRRSFNRFNNDQKDSKSRRFDNEKEPVAEEKKGKDSWSKKEQIKDKEEPEEKTDPERPLWDINYAARGKEVQKKADQNENPSRNKLSPKCKSPITKHDKGSRHKGSKRDDARNDFFKDSSSHKYSNRKKRESYSSKKRSRSDRDKYGDSPRKRRHTSGESDAGDIPDFGADPTISSDDDVPLTKPPSPSNIKKGTQQKTEMVSSPVPSPGSSTPTDLMIPDWEEEDKQISHKRPKLEAILPEQPITSKPDSSTVINLPNLNVPPPNISFLNKNDPLKNNQPVNWPINIPPPAFFAGNVYNNNILPSNMNFVAPLPGVMGSFPSIGIPPFTSSNNHPAPSITNSQANLDYSNQVVDMELESPVYEETQPTTHQEQQPPKPMVQKESKPKPSLSSKSNDKPSKSQSSSKSEKEKHSSTHFDSLVSHKSQASSHSSTKDNVKPHKHETKNSTHHAKHSSSKPKNPKEKNQKNIVMGMKNEGFKLEEEHLKILDEVPSSAVQMQVKEKFIKKLNRQERVVEIVKTVLKPYYNSKSISKEEYKDILRRSVPKICHNKKDEIDPEKIKAYIASFVKKIKHLRPKS